MNAAGAFAENSIQYGFLHTWDLLLTAGIIISAAVILFSLLRSAEHPERAYITAMLLMGSLFSFVLAPLSAPDEVAHYVGAYELSSKLMHAPLRDSDGHFVIRQQDTFMDDYPDDGDPNNATVLGMHLNRVTYGELHERGLKGTGETGSGFTLQEPVRTTPLAYLPQAVGFTAARLLGLGAFGLIYLGRFMNLLFFTVMGACSIRRIPIGKEVIFGVSLFPMTLELVSSLSYDAFILGTAFYLTAVVLELTLTERKIGWRDVLRISVLTVMLAPCKMVYAPMLLYCLIIPFRRWKNAGAYFGSILLIGILIAGSILLVNRSVFFQYVDTSQTVRNTAEWAGNGRKAETYSLIGTLRTPVIYLKILRNTFMIKGPEYLQMMVGHWLGNMDKELLVPMPMVTAFWAAAVLLGIAGKKEEPHLAFPKRLILFLVILAVVCLILTSMLTAYTPKRTDYALGVQGRYFLPMLPAFLLLFRCRFPSAGVKTFAAGEKDAALPEAERSRSFTVTPQTVILFLMLCMDAYILKSIFLTVCNRI